MLLVGLHCAGAVKTLAFANFSTALQAAQAKALVGAAGASQQRPAAHGGYQSVVVDYARQVQPALTRRGSCPSERSSTNEPHVTSAHKGVVFFHGWLLQQPGCPTGCLFS